MGKCGGKCGKKTGAQIKGTNAVPPVPAEKKDPRAGPRAGSDYAARALICNACPFNGNGWRCKLADRPLEDMRNKLIPCPLGKFPDEKNTVKYCGLSFNGVPMPIQQLNQREAKRRNRKPGASIVKGCGCIASLKAISECWAKCGKVKRSLSAALAWIAPRASLVFSHALEWGLKVWRLPELPANLLWRNHRRKRGTEKRENRQVTKEQLSAIAEITRNAVQGGTDPKAAIDAYLATALPANQSEIQASRDSLLGYNTDKKDGLITPLEIDPR